MSRSFKHNPIVKDNNSRKKVLKRQANRKVRRQLSDPEFEISAKGNDYRQLVETWEITDNISRWSKAQAIEYYEKQQAEAKLEGWRADVANSFLIKYPTLELWLIEWRMRMLSK